MPCARHACPVSSVDGLHLGAQYQLRRRSFGAAGLRGVLGGGAVRGPLEHPLHCPYCYADGAEAAEVARVWTDG